MLLIHGYPETKRIWWRNIEALAAAGFEVIAPDLRGMGDSDLPPDDRHDLVTYARDLYALVHDGLGHSSCLIAAGDVGGVVATDGGLPLDAGRLPRPARRHAAVACGAQAVGCGDVHQPAVGLTVCVRPLRCRLHDRTVRRRGPLASRLGDVPTRLRACHARISR
ncbi:alpha/beta fold hydrolase [Mycobacterium deserti]|uniref:alpha/beta fold hydrolase n=1 Tax=Mycobacterium deserti TaxID=2978347 RepID=UPI0036F1F8C0